jgi:hypothetical protein
MKPISEYEAQMLRKQLSTTAESLNIFIEFDDYGYWINKLCTFISTRDKKIGFGVEKYRWDQEFFRIDYDQIYPLILMSKYVPCELTFFGNDWKISISSYPDEEYSDKLEYGLRLYGSVTEIGKIKP